MGKELRATRTPAQIEQLERMIKKARQNPVKVGSRPYGVDGTTVTPEDERGPEIASERLTA